MLTLLALLPPTAVLVLMLVFRRHSAWAGTVGWLLALLIANRAFGIGWQPMLWAQVRGLFTALKILTIVWGAFLFYRTTEAAGTIEALVAHLRHLSPRREAQVLILAWGFAAFLQGVGGFGVPVAIVAPLMVALGFDPITAVLLPALGYSWAISFGSLGASILALSSVVAVDEVPLAVACAAFLAPIALLAGWAVLRLSGGSLRRSGWLWLRMGLAMGGVQLGAAALGLWNVAALLGALAALAVAVVFAEGGRNEVGEESSAPRLVRTGLKSLRTGLKSRCLGVRVGMERLGLDLPPLSRLLPYVILLALIAALRFLPPLRALFDVVMLRLTLPTGPTPAISLFGSTGTLLFYASLATVGLARRWGRLDRARLRRLRSDFFQGVRRTTFGLLVMVLLAATMEGAGMIELLARSLAALADGLFAPFAPWLGALVAFVTGSNMASNLLVGALQARMASLLGLRVVIILAAQNAGAALGSILSPAKLMIGCSTVGMTGREGEVMRALLRRFLPWLVLLALLSWALA
jgi:lactate permease